MSLDLRPLAPADRSWLKTFLAEHWGSHLVVSRLRVHDASRLPGFCLERSGQLLGVVTYHFADDGCEIVTLNSLISGRGIGSALVEAVRRTAANAGAGRLWLITTNDNLDALAFYQRRGFVLARLHAGAVNESRRLKPEIPLLADNGIPIRDELELEIPLG